VAVVPRWQMLLGVILAIGSLVGGMIWMLSVSARGRPSEEEAPSTPSMPAVPGPIRVEVLNGCGVGGAAGRVAYFLRSKGFDVVYEGNAEHFRFAETIVMDRAGTPTYAQGVADTLGVEHCVQQIKMDPYRIEDVTVIVGRDYRWMELADAEENRMDARGGR